MPSSKHVLVIEDHEDTLNLVTTALVRQGYHVTRARNGREGLDALLSSRDDPPVLVILDLNLPQMSGEQFFEVKQLYGRLAAIPVIVMTATEGKLEDEHVIGHFKKPVDPATLVRAVEAATP